MLVANNNTQNNDTIFNIKGGTSMNVGNHQGGHYTQNLVTDRKEGRQDGGLRW